MQQKPTVIVFDCFGVLFDDAFKALLAEHEHHLPKPLSYYQRLDELNGDGVIGDETYYAELSADFGLPVEELKKSFNNTHCRLEGTIDIIRELKPHYRIGLLSNIDRQFLQQFLDFKDTGTLFDTTFTSSEAGINKPERGIFEQMAAKLDAPFEEWFFIDDSLRNVEAALSYGINSCPFTSPVKLRKELARQKIL